MNRIALLGQPNSGKSTVFNQLTGSRQHVGNWPGKTVEKKDGTYSYKDAQYMVTDLPGSYGLSGNSDEEIITERFIKGGEADLICVLVDSSQLERSMYMLADFAGMDVPAILILNMMDVAAVQGKKINEKLLSERLGIPVLPFTAADGKGYEDLKTLIEQELKHPHKLVTKPDTALEENLKAEERMVAEGNSKYAWISKLLDGVMISSGKEFKLSKFDNLLLKPFWGKIVTIGIILVGFLAAMLIMSPFMSVAGMLPKLLGKPIADLLGGLHVHPWLVSVFSLLLPNTLYFCISMAAFVFGVNIVFGFLEEIGFLARAAYQFDGALSKLGLQGKAVAPILMGMGCTIGGASGTRVMDNWGQKMLTMMVVWAVPCASIWSIIPVISGMFFPAWGTALVCLGIIVYIFVLMFIVSKVFGGRLVPEGSRSGMIMELPPYHKAHWKYIIKEAWIKCFDMFKRALKTVTLVSVIFWIFSFSPSGNVESSLLYKVGTFIEPVTKFFGMGWQTFMAFISAAFAKEAVLGTLNAVFAGQSNVADVAFNASSLGVDKAALSAVMTQTISQAEALAFMFACTFSVPCLMALSTTYKESHSFAWTAKTAGFYVGASLVLSCIVYHIASLFMG
ncbi:MAG: ferrous iron transport protein B [Lachnospiraceae bacterium]|jgi:ferrous iron transport protein B|nr:ferrous iron transport protein B [Lachnospiraceae bacterium]